jgi:hypothetical protein
MIYSNNFIWLHFPKCAGSKVESIFLKYFSENKNIYQDIIDINIYSRSVWHDSIADRIRWCHKFVYNDQTVICSFRKLNDWLASRYAYEVKRSPALNHQPELLLQGKFLESDGRISEADYYAKYYLPEEILNSKKIKFIRNEFFEDDFNKIFSEFIDVSLIPKEEFTTRVNSSNSAITKKIKSKLDQENIYDKCPYWRKVENMAYSNDCVI